MEFDSTLVQLEAYLDQLASFSPLLKGALLYFGEKIFSDFGKKTFLDQMLTTPPGMIDSPEAIVETNWDDS